MKRFSLLFLPAIAILAILASCAQLEDAIYRDPVGVLQSAGKVGSAAIKASREITEEQEMYLGRSVSARILAQYPLYQNSKVHKYVNLVGTSVAMTSDRPDLPFHFAVLDNDQVNAFAAPGGYIFITRGTLNSAKDEEELAAVLAHEIGHVCARHSLKSVKSAMWQQVAVLTAQETAKHGGVNPELLSLFGQVTDKVLESLMTVGYEQPMEFEADRLGQTYAARAGYDPQGLRRFATLMQQREQNKDKSLDAWFGTHPTFSARLAQLPPAEGQVSPNAVTVRKKRFMTSVK